jgi:hypothetical protein
MSTTELVAKLRSTKSESKRKLLDEAADTIERLEAERNELAYRLGYRDGARRGAK